MHHYSQAVTNMAEKDIEKFTIRLHIYDEEIPVIIPREDEESYRSAAKLISERYNRYAQQFIGRKSDHTIALMTMLDIALQYEREHGKNDTTPYDNILQKLTAEIENTLGEQNKKNNK
jgi:hypothetical protein